MCCLYNWERCFSFSVCTPWPRKKYSPSDGSSNMPMTLSKVDFPEPDGPITEMNCPSATRRLMSFRMNVRIPPTEYHFEMCCSSSIYYFVMFKLEVGSPKSEVRSPKSEVVQFCKQQPETRNWRLSIQPQL